MVHDTPNDFELIVMMAVLQLPGKAYGPSLRNEIERHTDQELSYGTLYGTLDRLEKRNWLRSTVTKREPRPIRLYHFTVEGLKAFRGAGAEVQNLLIDPLHDSFWTDQPLGDPIDDRVDGGRVEV